MKLFLLTAAALFALSTSASASLLDNPLPGEVVPGQVLVSGKNLPQQIDEENLEDLRAAFEEEVVPGKVWLLDLGSGISVREGIQTLEEDPAVKYAEPNYFVQANSQVPVPSDEIWPELWGLENTGQVFPPFTGKVGADIDARRAWALENGSAGDITVGVVDTGIDLQHSDLDNRIWRNHGEIAGNNIDDDKNGYVDDLYGWNWVDANANPDDNQYHGTHVAGTIGAESNNGIGVTGVSWGARLAALKVLNAGGAGTTAHVIQAFDYAGRAGMEVVNASLSGGGFQQIFLDTIRSHPGTLYVAASGNEGVSIETNKEYPCSYNSTNMICVGASTQTDTLVQRADWGSNWGPTEVDLVAPGENIWSTVPSDEEYDYYALLDGTSMAAPHVAGVAALVRQYRPHGSAADYRSIILDSAERIASLQGKVATGARLDALGALQEAALRNPGASPPTVSIAQKPAWVKTKSPSWQFTSSGNHQAPQCQIVSSSGATWSGACATSTSHSVANLLEGASYTFTVTVTNSFGSASDTHSFRVDTISPAAPQITEAPPAISSSRSATWKIIGEEGAQFECQLISGWVPCSGPVTAGETSHSETSIPDGSYTFSVRQTDQAGNVSPVRTQDFRVDATPPPVPTVLSSPPQFHASRSATITFSSGEEVLCSLNEAEYTLCTSPLALASLAQGEHVLRLRARDAAGNLSTAAEISWVVDTVAPAAPTIEGPTGETSFRNVTFSLLGEEHATFRCASGTDAPSSCTSSVSFSDLPLGEFRFRARQVDRAGNISPEANRVLLISNSGLEISWSDVPASVTRVTSPLIKWQTTFQPYRVQCALNNSPLRNCSGSSEDQLSSLADGDYTFRVRIEDQGGAWIEKEYSFRVDTKPPGLTLSGPSGLHNSAQANFLWASNETVTFTCILNSGNPFVCSSPYLLISLQEGEHTFAVSATDAAGNTRTLSKSWIVDTVAPQKPTLQLLSERSQAAEVSIVSEESSTLECSLNDASWSACSSPWLNFLVDGDYKLQVRATDAAGNVSVPAEITWQVGPEKLPVPSLQQLEDGSLLLQGAEEGMDYLCSLASEPMSVCPASLRPRLSNGTYPYRLQIRSGERRSEEVRGNLTVSGAPTPPAGRVGASINNGAIYTRKIGVTLRLVWPAGTRKVIVANDGSFQGPLLDPQDLLNWQLDNLADQRLPRTVYVRYIGAGDEVLYSGSDDIILDSIAPQILSAALSKRGQFYRLRLRARDAVSGLRYFQIAARKQRPPFSYNGTRYRLQSDTVLQGRGLVPRWVRINDRASNWSAWVRLGR